MLKGVVRRVLERALATRGYELRPRGSPPRSFEDFLADAVGRGLAPRTVFDVGVGYGTPWLYAAFPDARHVMVEPLPVFAPHIARLCLELGAEHHPVALSDHAGTAQMRVPPGTFTSSSIKVRDPNFREFAATYTNLSPDEIVEVELQTLDHINRYEPPFLIKLDVEGAEINVLRGAERTLRDTCLLLTEVSIMPRYEGEPMLEGMLTFMREKGFHLIDFPSLSQAFLGGPLVYADAAFVPATDTRWRARR